MQPISCSRITMVPTGQSQEPASNKDCVMPNPCFTPGLASYLIQDGLLAAELLPELLAKCAQQKIALITHLVRENIVASENILACCAKYFSLPILDLSDDILQENLLPREFM